MPIFTSYDVLQLTEKVSAENAKPNTHTKSEYSTAILHILWCSSINREIISTQTPNQGNNRNSGEATLKDIQPIAPKTLEVGNNKNEGIFILPHEQIKNKTPVKDSETISVVQTPE